MVGQTSVILGRNTPFVKSQPHDSLIDLATHRVLITGGLGALGSACAARLRDAGAHVVLNDVLPADAGADYLCVDGSTDEGAQALLAAARDRAGELTDVVLLAGVVRPGGLLEQTAQDIEDVLRVNLVAATLTASAAVAGWVAEGTPGNLVFVSSWVQDVPWPGIVPYAASKAGLRATARGFAREFAQSRIRANVLAPGIVATGMALRQFEEDPAYRRRARRAVPLGALQSPDSVADALLFLCSPMASYMTGATLLVDGGASLYPLDPEDLDPDG